MADVRDENLLDEVLGRLEHSAPDAETQLLVLAAALGDVELAGVVGGGSIAAPEPGSTGRAAPPRTYLTEIAVEGFRGIAGTARIGVPPARA